MNTVKEERRWCVRDSHKIPYVGVRHPGKANDKSTWLSYSEAETLLTRHPNIFSGMGMFFSQREDNDRLCLCGIDIDAIGHDENKPNPLADEILDMFRDTYAEKSPSGTGYHIICEINLDDFPYERENYPFYEKNPNNSVEVYIGGITNRYFTYTGNKLDAHNEKVTVQTDNVILLLQKYMQKTTRTLPEKKKRIQMPDSQCEAKLSEETIEKRLELIRQSVMGTAFSDLFDKGNTERFRSASEADFALCSMLVPWLEGDPKSIDIAFQKSALYKNGREEKWNSHRGDITYGELTISNAIWFCVDPYYSEDPEYATGDSIRFEDIVRMINEVAQDERVKDKVSVIPFACGLGKSTAISIKIAEVLQSEGTDGMIIVTDSVERMYEYPAPTNTKLRSLREYIAEHEDEISVLEKNSKAAETGRQSFCRILIMSTQRYFGQLSREEVIDYTHWFYGRRPLVIIDEQPYLHEQYALDIKTLNKVEETLRMVQPDKSGAEEQDWCIAQWQKVVNSIKEKDMHYRRLELPHMEKNKDAYFFYKSESNQMTDDDKRFMMFIRQNISDFYADNVYGTIRAAQRMLSSWALVSRTFENKRYKIAFHTIDDHEDNIRDIGAKVIILDGTAMLSPEYSADYFDVRDYAACRRWLNKLTIHVLNANASKKTIDALPDKRPLAESIAKYAWRKNKGMGKRSVVFTYKGQDDRSLEAKLKEYFNTEGSSENVGHFGAIRGKNKYNEASFIIQYGLNRYPRPAYMLYYIMGDEETLSGLLNSDEETASRWLSSIAASHETTRIGSNLILADLEQNFYRGVIRMPSNTLEMQYHVFCNQKDPQVLDLIALMQLRYWPLQAKLKVTQRTPKEFMLTASKTHKGSNPDILRHWLYETCQPGRYFTYETITKETGLTTEQIRVIRSRNEDIDQLLKEWGRFQDKGTFRKPMKYNKKLNRL